MIERPSRLWGYGENSGGGGPIPPPAWLCLWNHWNGLSSLRPSLGVHVSRGVRSLGVHASRGVRLGVEMERGAAEELADRIGPRKAYTWLLCLGSLPVMAIGLADSFETFLLNVPSASTILPENWCGRSIMIIQVLLKMDLSPGTCSPRIISAFLTECTSIMWMHRNLVNMWGNLLLLNRP